MAQQPLSDSAILYTLLQANNKSGCAHQAALRKALDSLFLWAQLKKTSLEKTGAEPIYPNHTTANYQAA